MSHVVRYDLKVVLILLDSWEGARGSEDVKRVRILLDGYEWCTCAQKARIVARG